MEASKEAAIETCETVEDISKTVEDFSKKPNLMSELSILYFWPYIHFFFYKNQYKSLRLICYMSPLFWFFVYNIFVVTFCCLLMFQGS